MNGEHLGQVADVQNHAMNPLPVVSVHPSVDDNDQQVESVQAGQTLEQEGGGVVASLSLPHPQGEEVSAHTQRRQGYGEHLAQPQIKSVCGVAVQVRKRRFKICRVDFRQVESQVLKDWRVNADVQCFFLLYHFFACLVLPRIWHLC